MEQEEISSKIAQITFFGQTPFQLFEKPHEPRQTAGDQFIGAKLQKFRPGKMKLVCSLKGAIVHHMIYFEERGFVAVLERGQQMSLLYIPFQQRLQAAELVKLSDKCKELSIGKIVTSKYNQSFVANNQSILVMAGFTDNQFKLFKLQPKEKQVLQQLQSVQFHKSLINTVDITHNQRPYIRMDNFIAAGSKDCRITIWKFYEGEEKVSQEPEHILYGHHNEVLIIRISTLLNIVISVDLDGICIIHSLISGRFLRCMDTKLLSDVVHTIRVNTHGFILLLSAKNHVQIYT